jgi:predicted metal-dependent hydrolase
MSTHCLNWQRIKMSTNSPVIQVLDFEVDVVRKDIKNLHIGVYPPFGRVRVATPPQLDDEAVRLAVVARLPWIKKRRQAMQDQPRQTPREMVDGETHYVWGRPYRLRVVESGSVARVSIRPDGRLEMRMPVGSDLETRRQRLDAWYRRELRKAIPPLISKWAPVLGVDEPSWGIRQMKTKWGTCNRERGHVWLNLELAHKPPQCLEYITVHEMVHLLERNHTDRFFDLMTKFLPTWESHREQLNQAPLGHQEWTGSDTSGS